MKPAELRYILARVKPGPVKVVLSAKKVVTGIPSSGLWPRVTLKLDDQTHTVALTEYADPKKKEDDKGKLTKLEVAILRLAGVDSRSMRSVKRDQTRFPGAAWELREAVKRVQNRISSAISQAQTTVKLGSRIEQHQRKGRRSKAEEKMKSTFRELLRFETVKFRDLTPSQVGRFWQDVLNEKAVDDVHEL